jgi:glycosyltransferase involved in cell wall biosynthesis
MGYKVSVLVSVYGVERYIERCARSLFEQTYANLEYIFVDDASGDSSIGKLERVIKDYPEKEPAVKIIRHEANKGLAAARNTAFDNARGEFVCVVDADDWMEPDGIERLVTEQVATGADVVWGKALMHTEYGVQELSEPKYKDLMEWRICYFQFTEGLVMVNWRRIIRRSLLEEYHIRHEEGLHIGNDKQLMPLIAYYAESFSSIGSIVYHYERRNSTSRTYKSSHGGYDLFAHTREVESMKRVIRFLADKEPGYLRIAQFAKLEKLLRYRKEALQNASREGFEVMVNYIMETPAIYRSHIGWSAPSLIMGLKKNYKVSRFWTIGKQLVKRILTN